MKHTHRAARYWILAAVTIVLAVSQVEAFDAQIGWSPLQSVMGYRVYVRQLGQSYAAGTDVGLLQPDTGVVRYIARGLPNGIVNYVAVTAYDGSGRESGFSNELSVSVGLPASTATRSATATASRTAPGATATSGPPGTPTPGPSNTRTAASFPSATAALGTTTIWPPGALPGNPAVADASAVELGVKFTSDVNGVIRGVRFYKGAANVGTHTGSLWSGSGQRLATATFAGESASGWQQVNFASPVAISAGTVYVASYHTDVGYYAGDNYYFTAAGADRPPLHALPHESSGGNGVYAYGPSAFPTNSSRASNYWVDVVFSASQASPATSTMAPAVTATSTMPRKATRTMLATVRTATPSPTPTATSIPPTAALTIWAPAAVPANPTIADASAVELGVKFTSDVNGTIRGIRFYKGAGDTGTHTGSVWTSSGQRLRIATFTGETASGWQQVYFISPVAISAGVVYVASYHSDVGRYAGDTNYFSAAGVDRPPLHALRNGASGGNGVYVYGASAFPANSYEASNYWVDVIFSPTQ